MWPPAGTGGAGAWSQSQAPGAADVWRYTPSPSSNGMGGGSMMAQSCQPSFVQSPQVQSSLRGAPSFGSLNQQVYSAGPGGLSGFATPGGQSSVGRSAGPGGLSGFATTGGMMPSVSQSSAGSQLYGSSHAAQNSYVPPPSGAPNSYVPPSLYSGSGSSYVPPPLFSGSGSSYVPPPLHAGSGSSYVPPPWSSPQRQGGAFVRGYSGGEDMRPTQPPQLSASPAPQFPTAPPQMSRPGSYVPPPALSPSLQLPRPELGLGGGGGGAPSCGGRGTAPAAQSRSWVPPAVQEIDWRSLLLSGMAASQVDGLNGLNGVGGHGHAAPQDGGLSRQEPPKAIPLQQQKKPAVHQAPPKAVEEPEPTLESHARVRGNEECADCGARGPEWASVNQGTMICIACAGIHRSLGAHISKVKSLTLDSWKPEEVRAFCAQGGNAQVNEKLKVHMLPRPRPGASRHEMEQHIAEKYAGQRIRKNSFEALPPPPPPWLELQKGGPSPCSGASGRSPSGSTPGFLDSAIARPPTPPWHFPPPAQHQYGGTANGHGNGFALQEGGSSGSNSRPRKSSSPSRVAAGASSANGAGVGFKCHQGLVIVEVQAAELSDDRARELRMLGPLFLSMAVELSLGTTSAEWTSTKRGAQDVSWEPAERRELLWDAEERWLQVQLHDGEQIAGLTQVAGRGRIDLLALNAEAQLRPGDPFQFEVDIYAPGEDDDSHSVATVDSDGSVSPHRQPGSRLGLHHEGDDDPDDPERHGEHCGTVHLQVTLIDMSGMLAAQERRQLGGNAGR
eukprot:TRINITY_DN6980_c0_g1_i1.p1 TRINITY_DN6980_c0_g1~~TRINITY_DN6980_c0_g1_i1.p1  ORF type:complete len:784 (-),score=144.53 TRINITY_DN6980_c0_g1_i1:140-2491(-)